MSVLKTIVFSILFLRNDTNSVIFSLHLKLHYIFSGCTYQARRGTTTDHERDKEKIFNDQTVFFKNKDTITKSHKIYYFILLNLLYYFIKSWQIIV